MFNNATQRTDYIALATNAVRSGIIAHNACEYLASAGYRIQRDLHLGLMVSTGISLKRALELGYEAAAADYEDWQAGFIETATKVRIRIVYDKKTRIILGACLRCARNMIFPWESYVLLAIQNRLRLTS